MLRTNDSRVFVLLMVLLPASALLSQTAGSPATFDGQVMNRSNGRPLAAAEIKLHGSVAISRDPLEFQEYSAISGADGRFAISGIVPGDYFISVSRQGYTYDHPETGVPRNGLPKQPLAAGESAHSVLFMLADPIITGRVLDSTGAPAEHVDVSAISTENSHYATTDDRGDFRMVVDGPGPYLVRAIPDKHLLSEIRRDGTTPVVYGLTYFQSSQSAASAEWVTPQFGKETNVEIKLQPAAAAQVSGMVSGIPPGERATVSFKGVEEIATVTDQEGKFTLWRIPAGRYHLYARSSRRNSSNEGSNNADPLSSPSVVLDVGATSIEGINLELTPPVTLKLRFRDGDWENYKSKMKRVRFELRGEGHKAIKPPNASGEASMDKLPPGSLHVVVQGLPENMYVKALRPSQGEARRNTIEAGSAPEQEVEIELGTDGAEISGVVRNKAGEAAESKVFLLDDEDPDLSEVQTATTKKDGHYHFDGVAPGKYQLLAYDKDGAFRLSIGILGGEHAGIINNQEIKELFRSAMVKIEVSAGSKATRDLKIY